MFYYRIYGIVTDRRAQDKPERPPPCRQIIGVPSSPRLYAANLPSLTYMYSFLVKYPLQDTGLVLLLLSS